MLKISCLTALLLLGNLLLGSTAAQSKKSPPPPTEIEQRTGHGAAAPPGQWRFSLPDGVKLEDGLSEDEAVAIALWNNAQLHADLSVLGLARADLLDAGLLRNPLLQIVLPIGPYRQFESLLSFPLEVFWQRRKRVEAAAAELARVAISLEQNGLNLMRDVRLAYLDLRLANERARLAGEAVRVREQVVKLTNVRLRVGDVSDIEATSARLDESLALEQATRLRREVVTAQNRLRQWLGMEAGTAFTLSETDTNAMPAALQADDPAGGNAAPDDLFKLAIASRPDLRAAELAIEAATKRAKWEHSRVMTLAGLLNLKQGEGVPFAPRPGVLLELPIFNRNQGGIARGDAEVERAAWQFFAVRQRIAGEVQEAFDQYQQARASLTVWQAQVMPQAAENARLSERAFNRGDQSYLFVLDALRRVVDVRGREAELRTEMQRAAAQLDRAIGQKSWRNFNVKP
ncbi:MAG TPA: TolC family protein [Blastocatellia bacterium]|nr:TolC family protein [Blastocatellia bacterium]